MLVEVCCYKRHTVAVVVGFEEEGVFGSYPVGHSHLLAVVGRNRLVGHSHLGILRIVVVDYKPCLLFSLYRK